MPRIREITKLNEPIHFYRVHIQPPSFPFPIFRGFYNIVTIKLRYIGKMSGVLLSSANIASFAENHNNDLITERSDAVREARQGVLFLQPHRVLPQLSKLSKSCNYRGAPTRDGRNVPAIDYLRWRRFSKTLKINLKTAETEVKLTFPRKSDPENKGNIKAIYC